MIARGEVALAVYSAGQSLIYYENGNLSGIDPLVPTILFNCSFIYTLPHTPKTCV